MTYDRSWFLGCIECAWASFQSRKCTGYVGTETRASFGPKQIHFRDIIVHPTKLHRAQSHPLSDASTEDRFDIRNIVIIVRNFHDRLSPTILPPATL